MPAADLCYNSTPLPKIPITDTSAKAIMAGMFNLALPLLTVVVPLLNFLLMVTFSNHTRS